MCGTGNEHSHSDAAHGTLSNAEKTAADLRDDLGEVLKLVNKFEYQRAVISGADFPAAEDVAHSLEHILEDQKAHAALLIQLINEIDVVQRNKFEGDEGNGHEHEHEGHEHAHEHPHKH